MKSLFQILGESVEKLTDEGKFKQYRERLEPGMSIESKIAVAQKVLKEVSKAVGGFKNTTAQPTTVVRSSENLRNSAKQTLRNFVRRMIVCFVKRSV